MIFCSKRRQPSIPLLKHRRLNIGSIFTPSTASQICRTGKNSCAADAAHCEGVVIHSYGTNFEVVEYDANNCLFSILFSHYIGAVCKESWDSVFYDCKSINGSDSANSLTVVDQEKSTDMAYESSMQRESLFLDPLHIRKNMTPHLQFSKATVLAVYHRAVY